MSEFNRQLGVARDAFTSSSKANYGSEEADLTDAIIKNQETIDMPNTVAFFNSVKEYERVKDQGSFLNTMKQVAGVFSAAAQFKKVSDAKDKENEGFEFMLGQAGEVKSEVVDQFNAQEKQLETERKDADFELETEAKTQTGEELTQTNEAAYNLLHTDIDGANLKQVAFSIGDQFKPVLNNVMAGKGLDGISTTGEAFDEIDKGVKTVLGAALYEALENGVDITNDRIFKRYIKKITPKLMETRAGLRDKWAANQEVKLENARNAQLNSDIREAVINNDSDAIFSTGGLLDKIRATKFGNAPGSYPLAMQYLEDQIVSDIQKDAFGGGEGTLISPDNLNKLLDEGKIVINGKEYNGLLNVPDNVISKQLKERFERRVIGALQDQQTEAASDLEQRKTNLKYQWDLENIDKPMAALRNNPVKMKEFLSDANLVVLQSKWINYARNQVDGDGVLLYDTTIDGQPKLTDKLNALLAKADTGVNDTEVNSQSTYQDQLNTVHKDFIETAVLQHIYADKGADKKLVGSDNMIYNRMVADFNSKFRKSLPELEQTLAALPAGADETLTIQEHMNKVYQLTKTNLDNNVYDAPLSIGGSVSIPLVKAKQEFVQSYINDEGLKDAPEATNLAEKNNFERSKGWRDSGGTINTDVISFYDDVPMFKMVNGKKVPMTSLEKFLYRARAVKLLTTDESAKIAKWDETMEFYTEDDRISLLNKPTDGKFFQVSAESLPIVTDAAKAMKAGPNNTFDSIESPKLVAQSKGKTPRQLSRLPKVKSLQEMTLEELERAVYDLDATNIGYYGFGGFEALDLLQQLGAKPGQKITEDVQTAMRFLKLQNNITRRKNAMSGLTVVNSNAAWVEATTFTYDEMQAIKKVFPLLEGYDMTNLGRMQRQVAKVFITDLEKYGTDNLAKAGYRIVTGVPKRQEIDEIVEKERIPDPEPLERPKTKRTRR
tara:strand:+ start:218 stop:3061 length:2844 start_codon:yes stop_codon:yes gene_type:complete